MFARREFDWLNHRFQESEYDLIYLDPLVCSLAQYKTEFSPWIHQRPEEQARESFIGRLIETLGIKSGDNSSPAFLETKGFGTRLKGDRALQRRVAHVINQHLNEIATRHYHSVVSLQKQKARLENMADRSRGGSLIIVDAMFSNRAGAPEEIQQVVQSPVQYLDNSMRNTECMLTDSLGPALTLCDPVIGLMVDEIAFYNWTEAFNIILSAGWYPFARTVGLYATVPGGPPFINVIAILMRPYPSFHEVLTPPQGKPKRCCLPGTLEHVLEKSLEPEIKRLQTGGITPTKVYDRDKEFLSPVYVFKFFYQLNRMSCQGLQTRANHAYQVLKTYLERLRVLGECLKGLNMESQILSLETDVQKFLPELGLLSRC